MTWKTSRRTAVIVWQLLFILLSTTWLWAPHLNPGLSDKTSLISQYETPSEAFSWLFRLGDSLGALVLLAMAITYIKTPGKKTMGWLIAVIGAGLFLDPIFTTSCHATAHACKEYFSVSFLFHAIETVVTSLAVFAIAFYDAWLRRKIVSVFFALFQVAYGILFVSQLANQEHFNTVSQYFYQLGVIVYLAWLCRDFLPLEFKPGNKELKVVKLSVAAWAFLNGILAILIGLAHIHLLGKIKGVYFAGDNAWLAQHGVIIGVVMLYLSRHLARGEMRARQIFLAISGVEVIKYSVVALNPALMVFYMFTFCVLFVLRDDFGRGSIAMTWKVRLRDLYFMVAGLLFAALASLILLDRDSRASTITSQAFDNFFDYVANSDLASRTHVRSALLAHTISVFLAAAVGSVLWILFRPYPITHSSHKSRIKLRDVLGRYSTSSEDYFKLWPEDKEYFWQKGGNGFVAYRLVGPIAFALADPVTNDKAGLLHEFLTWTRAHRATACFLPVTEISLPIYQEAGFETMQIGSSAVVNIDDFLTDTVNDKWWRWQKNRAVKSGYTYHSSSPPHSKTFLKNLRTISDTWLSVGGHQERGFALGSFNEEYLQECRIHYLKDGKGKVVAFTNQVPNLSPMTTFTVDLLRYLPDANNAMSYLLYKTIENAAADTSSDYRFFDLGFVPFAKASGALLAIARTLSNGRFSSRGLEQFKNKFKPQWQPYYLAYEGDLADLAQIALNLEKAMDVSRAQQ